MHLNFGALWGFVIFDFFIRLAYLATHAISSKLLRPPLLIFDKTKYISCPLSANIQTNLLAAFMKATKIGLQSKGHSWNLFKSQWNLLTRPSTTLSHLFPTWKISGYLRKPRSRCGILRLSLLVALLLTTMMVIASHNNREKEITRCKKLQKSKFKCGRQHETCFPVKRVPNSKGTIAYLL